jgi:predicted nucleic acid-binding protein
LIVVDASILADFLLGRPEAMVALDEALLDRPHEPLHAPELIEPEALNALRGLVRGGVVSDHRAAEAMHDLAALRLVRHPHAPLRARVWDLRGNLSAYDATYLALAEALDDPLLLTGDDALAMIAGAQLGPGHVRHIP